MPEFTMNFERRGTGRPPIVFVHGVLCRHEDWFHQVAYLEATNETIAVDLRGMGRSPRGEKPITVETLGQDVADLLMQEDVTGAVLVGHSTGCRVAVEACVRAPDRVAGLVLNEGGYMSRDHDAAVTRLERWVEKGGFKQMVIDRFSQLVVGTPPAWGAETVAYAASVPEDVGLPLMKDTIEHDKSRLPTAIGQVKVPVLIIQALGREANGRPRPVKEGERLPLQELVEDSGVTCDVFNHVGPGHFNMVEDPITVNAQIEQFIAARVTA
jgi:pimeloyl-ACP methyl ester carboxylesterase